MAMAPSPSNRSGRPAPWGARENTVPSPGAYVQELEATGRREPFGFVHVSGCQLVNGIGGDDLVQVGEHI